MKKEEEGKKKRKRPGRTSLNRDRGKKRSRNMTEEEEVEEKEGREEEDGHKWGRGNRKNVEQTVMDEQPYERGIHRERKKQSIQLAYSPPRSSFSNTQARMRTGKARGF